MALRARATEAGVIEVHSGFQPCGVNPLWDDAGGPERAEVVAKDDLSRIQKGLAPDLGPGSGWPYEICYCSRNFGSCSAKASHIVF